MARVNSPTSYSSSGLRDWLVQRVTAFILGIYALFLLTYLLMHPHLEYADWVAFFTPLWVKIFTFLAMLSLYLHAWIGIWTVLTDYAQHAALRLLLQVIVILALLSYFVWGIAIIWHV